MEDFGNTRFFQVEAEQENGTRIILDTVYHALTEKGYNPVNQIVGYIMSGDPTYITNHQGARSLIMKVERDELVEELIMGLDFGSKTVGVAISDPLLITAQGVTTIHRKGENKLRRTLAQIEALIEEYEVSEIVLGNPKHMNADAGERSQLSAEFKEMLERRTGLPVVLWDERLTTVAAEKTLIEANVRREHRKEYVDKIAAVLILQGYLDYKSNQKMPET